MKNINTKLLDIIFQDEICKEICINDGVTGFKQIDSIKLEDRQITIKQYRVGETYFRSNGDLDAKLKTENFNFPQIEISNLEVLKTKDDKVQITIVSQNEKIDLLPFPFDENAFLVIKNLLKP